MKPELELVHGGDALELESARWFARLRADDVSALDRSRWQRWMDADPRHVQAYQHQERLWSELADYANSDAIAGEVRAARRAIPEARRRRSRLAWAGAGLAAALAVTVGGMLHLTAPPQEILLVTAIGERRDVRLDDGSQVSLDADSQLRVTYSRKARDLSLDRGRLYVEAAPDPARPLAVHTEDGSIEAVGTAFDVHRRGDGTEVVLVEGRVLVRNNREDTARAQTVAMTAGQQARLARGQAQPRIQAAQLQGPPAWRSGRLVFSDQPLADVVEEFNRYSPSRIELTDGALADLRVNGVFRSEDPQSFLDGLSEMYPVQLDTSTSGIVRIRPRTPVYQRH